MSKSVDRNVKEKGDWLLSLFGSEELRYLPDKIREAVLSNDHKVYDEFLAKYPDLTKDAFQDFFETYFADRTFLNQDFTPPSIAQLIAAINGDSQEIMDECAGTGSLIIAQWTVSPNVTVYARELSASTIPFLLFNLAIRNMQGIVIRGNTLTFETFNVYLLNKGKTYSTVTEIDFSEEVKKLDPMMVLKYLHSQRHITGQA